VHRVGSRVLGHVFGACDISPLREAVGRSNVISGICSIRGLSPVSYRSQVQKKGLGAESFLG
jgi:hypothetical protein